MNIKHFIFFFIALALFSCNKDRVEDPSSDFEPLDAYRSSQLEPVQNFTITTDNGNPIVGKKGTIVYPNRLDFETLTGADVDLPYDVQLIELYTTKDFIINTKQTLSSGNVTNSAGMVKVTATKDGQELRLKAGKFLRVDLNTTYSENDLAVYQGTFPDYEFTNWTPTSDGSTVANNNNKYALSLGSLGWSNTGKTKSSDFVTVTYTINATGTEFIELYAKPLDYHGLVKGGNLVIGNIPKGQSVQLLAMAMDSDGKFRLMNQTVSLDADQTIELELGVYDESGFNSIVNGL